MQYDYFGVEDFVMDEAFRNWVQNPVTDSQSFWENWLVAHPHKTREVEEARRIIESIDFRDDLSVQERQKVWQRIEAATVQPAQELTIRTGAFNRIWRNQSPYYRIAAAVALLMVLGAVIYLTMLQFGKQEYQTAYGEIQMITLPDGSQVTLNANSSLHYDRNWSAGENREVWLEGEAFFKVTKQTTLTPNGKNPVKFTVHTRQLDVQVLGTQFNVQDRAEEIKVSLNEGKVKVLLPENTEATHKKEGADVSEITLEPGQIVAYSHENRRISKQQTNPELYSAWTSHKYIFQNTSLREIVAMLEHNYGVEVTVQDPAMLEQRLTGTVMSDNLETLLKALSATADLNVKREQNQILFFQQD